MHIGLRDSLQTGIKWQNVADILIPNDASTLFVKNFISCASKNLSQKRLRRSFIRISVTISLYSPSHNAWTSIGEVL